MILFSPFLVELKVSTAVVRRSCEAEHPEQRQADRCGASVGSIGSTGD